MNLQKKTPLYARHVEEGGKMVDFAGWLLPVNYQGGIIKEHLHTREHASIFDVSHMGEILIKGPGAFDFAQRLLSNDISKVNQGRAVYSPMCNEQGGCVDDLLVYPYEDGLLLVVNAGNDQKDFDWIKAHAPSDVALEHASPHWGQIALQGPESADVLARCGLAQANELKFFGVGQYNFDGVPCLISRSGYTGEDGFELYMQANDAPKVWDNLRAAGAEPAGLGCRDTLRFEAGLVLYGHEISEQIGPLEAGLHSFVKPDKPGGFIGCEALRAPQTRRQIGLSFLGRGIARQDSGVYANGALVGAVTTGLPSPSTGKTLAIALVGIDTPDDAVFEIEVRGKREPAECIATPFYRRPRKK